MLNISNIYYSFIIIYVSDNGKIFLEQAYITVLRQPLSSRSNGVVVSMLAFGSGGRSSIPSVGEHFSLSFYV